MFLQDPISGGKSSKSFSSTLRVCSFLSQPIDGGSVVKKFSAQKMSSSNAISKDFQATFLFGCHQASELLDLQVTPVSQGLPTKNQFLLRVRPNGY